MAADVLFKTMNSVHRVALALSGGRLGWRASGMPVVELTTTGRKSGQKHTVMLTSPWQEGSTYVVVASRGGDDRTPAWFLNLQANPDVEVSVQGGQKQQVRARVAAPDERARLWPLLSEKHKNYAGYQRRTSREIPLALLDLPG